MNPIITAELAADHAAELRREAEQQHRAAAVRKHRARRRATSMRIRHALRLA